MVQGTQIHYNGNTVHASAALNSLSSTLPRVACSLFPMYIALIKVMCHSHENHIYIHTEARHGARGFGIRGSSPQLCNTSGAVCHLQPIAGYDVRSPKSQAAHIEFIKGCAALSRIRKTVAQPPMYRGARFNIQLATCILNPVNTRFRIQAYCIYQIDKVMRQGFECK